MTNYIAPKPATYNGVDFRSQLETRWAIFLDHHPLVTAWSYEPCKFEWKLNGPGTDGSTYEHYTPDFLIRVQAFEFILEVKPEEITHHYRLLLQAVAKISGIEVICGIGSWFNPKPWPTIRSSADDFATSIPLKEHLLGSGRLNKIVEIVQNARFDIKTGLPTSPRIAGTGDFDEIRKKWREYTPPPKKTEPPRRKGRR